MLARIEEYTKRGWAIFAVKGKDAPRCKWRKCSTTDPARVRAMYRRGDNLAVDCGKSGLVVIDPDRKPEVDGLANWAELKAERAIDDSGALQDLTGGGGRHQIWSDTTGGAIRNSTGKLAPGIDVRANGGYILLPGSTHPDTGKPYVALGDWDREPGDLPDALRDLLLSHQAEPEAHPSARSETARWKCNDPSCEVCGDAPTARPARTPRNGNGRSAYAEAALAGELAILASTPEGQRNHQLNTSAFVLGQLVGAGELAEAEVRAALKAQALAIGLTERETMRTIASGMSAGLLHPRADPEERAPLARPVTSPAAPPWQAPFELPRPPAGLMEDLEATGDRADSLTSCGTVGVNKVDKYRARARFIMWRCGKWRWCEPCRKAKMNEILRWLKTARFEGDVWIGKLAKGEGTQLVRKLGKDLYLRLVLADDAQVLMAAAEPFEGSRPLTGDDLTRPEALAWWDRVIEDIPEGRNMSGRLGKPLPGDAEAGEAEPDGTIEVEHFATDGDRATMHQAFDRARARTPMIPGPDLASIEASLARLTAAWKEEARDLGLLVTHQFSRTEECDISHIRWEEGIWKKSHREPESAAEMDLGDYGEGEEDPF